MKKTLVIFFLFFSFCAFLWGQEQVVIQETNMLPLHFYVGDEVELRLIILANPGNFLKEPSSLPKGKWIEINKFNLMKLEDNVYEVRIFLKTFMHGTHILPSIKLGDVFLSNVKIYTRSILDDRGIEELSPLQAQLDLAGTWLTFFVFLLFIVILPYILFVIRKFLLRLINRIQQERIKSLPGIRLRQGLRKLKKNLPRINARSFFINITELIRKYLSARFKMPILSATTTELKKMLIGKLPRAEYIEKIILLFKRADYVKFGGQAAKKNEMKNAIDNIFKILNSIEEDLNVES